MAKMIVRVTGRYIVDVPDDLDIEGAVEYANDATGEVDFGELSNIDWDSAVYEDARGNRIRVG